MRKKFTMLFAALTLVLGSAWAQVEVGSYYRIKWVEQDLYLTIDNYNGEGATGAHGTVPFMEKSESNLDQVWTVEETGTANEYYLKSKSGYYIVHGGWNIDAYNSTNNKGKVSFVVSNEAYKIKNINAGQWYKVEIPNGGGDYYYPYCDGGEGVAASFTFEEVDEAEFSNLATITYNFVYDDEVKFTQKSDVTLNTEFPNYNVDFPFGIVAAEKPSGVVTEGGVHEIELSVQLPFEVAEDVEDITTWYYARMHTNNPGYLGDIAEDGTINVAGGKSSDVASEDFLWGFAGNVWDGIFVVNKGRNLKLTSTGGGFATLTAEGTPFYLAKTNQTSANAKNGFCLRRFDSNQYLNANYTDSKIAHWGVNDAGSTMFLTEYEEAEASVSELGWATLYLGYATYIPEGVNAYAVTAAEGGNATLTQLEGVIPANTGVILENEGEFTFKMAAKNVAAVEGSLLRGSVEAEEVTVAENQVAYILANASNGVGLYKAALTDGKFTNGANKAYMILDKEVAAEVAMFSFGRGEGTTGIEQIVNNENVVIFDLAGRRVQKMEKGIYIVNGKKVIR